MEAVHGGMGEGFPTYRWGSRPSDMTSSGAMEMSDSTTTTKERVLEAVRKLPEDATVEDAIERLYFLAKVERGLKDAEDGRTISHEEVRERFLK